MVDQVRILIFGKRAFKKLVLGRPRITIGMMNIADGKVIEEGNSFSTKELTNSILKILRNVNFEVASVSTKIGNGVPLQ